MGLRGAGCSNTDWIVCGDAYGPCDVPSVEGRGGHVKIYDSSVFVDASRPRHFALEEVYQFRNRSCRRFNHGQEGPESLRAHSYGRALHDDLLGRSHGCVPDEISAGPAT